MNVNNIQESQKIVSLTSQELDQLKREKERIQGFARELYFKERELEPQTPQLTQCLAAVRTQESLSKTTGNCLMLDQLANHSTTKSNASWEKQGFSLPSLRAQKLEEADHIKMLHNLFAEQKPFLPVGPSLLMELFADHIFAAFRACQKEMHRKEFQFHVRVLNSENKLINVKGSDLFTLMVPFFAF